MFHVLSQNCLLTCSSALPSLNRFMRGSTFETLRQVAHDHPVVMLVSCDNESYAVMISSPSQDQPDVIELEVTLERMVQLQGRTRGAGYHMRESANCGSRDSWSEPTEDSAGPDDMERLTMRLSDASHTLNGVLCELWKIIVKPVLDKLSFEVRVFDTVWFWTDDRVRRWKQTNGRVFIGARPVTLRRFPFTQRVSTQGLIKSVRLTT
jgi:hypothetical protein